MQLGLRMAFGSSQLQQCSSLAQRHAWCTAKRFSARRPSQHVSRFQMNHLVCAASSSHNGCAVEKCATSGTVIACRRSVLQTLAAAAFASPGMLPCSAGAAGNLEGYSNPKEGYRIDQPAAWELTSKAGADVLFVDPERKSSTLGVTVSPIRVDSLDAFGDLDSVATRLLAAEKAKESTLGVQLLRQAARKGAASGVTMYDYEYELDSTRGRKRILSTVAIANRKLYIVNGAAKCEGGSCEGAAEAAAALMRAAAASFDTL